MDFTFIKSIFSGKSNSWSYEVFFTLAFTVAYLWLMLVEKALNKHKKFMIFTSVVFVSLTYAISLYYVILLNGLIVPSISNLEWNSLFIFMIITLNIYGSIFFTNWVRCKITKKKFNYNLIRLLFYLTYATMLIIYYVENDSLTSQIYIVLVVETTLDISITVIRRVLRDSRRAARIANQLDTGTQTIPKPKRKEVKVDKKTSRDTLGVVGKVANPRKRNIPKRILNAEQGVSREFSLHDNSFDNFHNTPAKSKRKTSRRKKRIFSEKYVNNLKNNARNK